ncbi:hypothetical protein T439DRAFT_127090 [Meredithblackwellia eburnea MCA 4105]
MRFLFSLSLSPFESPFPLAVLQLVRLVQLQFDGDGTRMIKIPQPLPFSIAARCRRTTEVGTCLHLRSTGNTSVLFGQLERYVRFDAVLRYLIISR